MGKSPNSSTDRSPVAKGKEAGRRVESSGQKLCAAALASWGLHCLAQPLIPLSDESFLWGDLIFIRNPSVLPGRLHQSQFLHSWYILVPWIGMGKSLIFWLQGSTASSYWGSFLNLWHECVSHLLQMKGTWIQQPWQERRKGSPETQSLPVFNLIVRNQCFLLCWNRAINNFAQLFSCVSLISCYHGFDYFSGIMEQEVSDYWPCQISKVAHTGALKYSVFQLWPIAFWYFMPPV